MNPGFLLALEGIDGSGKSTACEGIARALRADGHEVVTTQEPTRGRFGRRIREMAASGRRVEPQEELRWFAEDRREHVSEVIAPALGAGRVVVCDRYFLSTVAYQGARGLDWNEILEHSEQEFPLPGLALIFVLDPAAGLARARARGGTPEPAFEDRDFLTRVAEVYAALERPWIARLDATRPEAEVLADGLACAREAIRQVTVS